MFATLGAFLLKIGIGSIAGKIADAYTAKQNAQTDQERIAADERIKALEARRDVLIAESRTPVNALMRALFALPVALYYGKIFCWDKVLGWGKTDPLSPELTHIAMIIVGFYFLTDAATTVTRMIKR